VDVTAILLLTDEDDFNALAATVLAGNPQATVYRLAPSEPRHGVLAPYTFSETLFAPELNHPGMNARHTAGAHITTRRANGAIRPEDHLLFLINGQGTLIPTTTETTPTPHPGDTLVLLTPGAQERRTPWCSPDSREARPACPASLSCGGLSESGCHRCRRTPPWSRR